MSQPRQSSRVSFVRFISLCAAMALAPVGCSDDPEVPDVETDVSEDVTTDEGVIDVVDEPGEPPLLTALEPSVSPPEGGVQITGRGTGFVTPTSIFFGDNEADSVIVIDGESLSIIVPAATLRGLVDVRIETRNGSSVFEDGFTYLASDTPFVEGVSPSQGDIAGGETVVITGRNLPTEGTVSVVFGAIAAADVILDSAAQFTVETPIHDFGTVNMTFNLGGEVQVVPDAFTFIANLSLDYIVPNVGEVGGGTPILIFGGGFVDGLNLEVTFGGTLADPDEYLFQGGSMLVVTPDRGEGCVDVTVSGDNGEVSLTDAFCYGTPLVVSEFDPDVVPLSGGEVVVSASGIDVDASHSVQIGDNFASDLVAAEFSLTFTAPEQSEVGVYDVWIQQDAQRVLIEGGLEYSDE